ncbi:MAG: DUF2828 family protein [Candidatus Cloacimonadaceae bacterium]
MNKFINSMMYNNSRTENYGLTHSTSGNALIDMFFLFGAMRHQSDDDIITIFDAAYKTNRKAAIKLLLYTRDISEGMGERRVFRLCLYYLYVINEHRVIDQIIDQMSYLIKSNITRVDDFLYLAQKMLNRRFSVYHKYEYKTKRLPKLINTRIAFVDDILNTLFTLMEDKEIGPIVAKWMPRKTGQYKYLTRYMRKYNFIESYSSYRKQIVGLSNTVEQQMSARDWNNINLEQVPSLSMKKYKTAFFRHEIMQAYLEKLQKGEAKINAQRLTPGDIVLDLFNKYRGLLNDYPVYGNDGNPLDSDDLRVLFDAQWNNLKQLDDLPKEFRALPMIDVSGSMFCPNYIPISNSVGLGLFIAENNPNEVFKNHFITFTSEPRFQKIVGHDIVSKVENSLELIGYNTDIQAAFELILNKAVDENIPPDEMPTHLIIFSDMEFDDSCIEGTSVNALTMMTELYEEFGYTRPTIVFWNVNGRIGNVPAKDTETDVLLVSGYSQNVVNLILKQHYNDVSEMLNVVLENERYNIISK